MCAGRAFHILLAEKKNYLASDDFTCGKARDCTLCLVEMECRSLTLENSILRYLGADPCTTLYTLQRVICLARSETKIQFSSLNSAIPTCDLEGWSRTKFYFCLPPKNYLFKEGDFSRARILSSVRRPASRFLVSAKTQKLLIIFLKL